MESLLANYGSDDEEDEGPQEPQEPPARARAPLFASLPPPKAPGEGPAPRSSLFSSLPRPKFAGDDTWKPGFRVSKDATEKNPSHISASDLSNKEENDRNPRLSRVSEDAFSATGLHSKVSVGTRGLIADDDTSKSKRGSLFSALPPPKSTSSSFGPLQSQPLPGFPSKRVVQLRPNINPALLKDRDDEDDWQPQAKRHATDVAGSGKPTGLAAILPKPKNLGSTLGSGYASGHHASLDVGTPSVAAQSVAENSASTPQSVHEPSSIANEFDSETGNTHGHVNGSHMGASARAWQGSNLDLGADVQTHTDTVDQTAAFYESKFVTHEGAEILCPEGYFEVPDEYSEEMFAHEASTVPSAQDPLADVLLKERRKGGKNAPVNIIEVKQADLTAKKLREDQLRTTGIAFGPAYRPISSNKDKPTKLHRRKHQIGSLYYDMKQKEMELIERRARGNMTKAVTQGKYGW